MKKIIITIALFLTGATMATAQNEAAKANDAGRIAITPQVNDQTIPSEAKNLLLNKMKQICTKNGLAGDAANPFFIMDATVSVLSKELTPTAPPMHALNMQINFFIKDAATGNVYSETSHDIKGVGQNETKAYIAGLKNINPSMGKFKAMVDKGKEKILEFYNSQCDVVLARANALKQQGNNNEAIKVLKSVPPVCLDCYNKSMELLATIPAPADEPVADAQQTTPAQGNMNTGSYQIEIDPAIFLVYTGSKVLGNKLMLYFQFENRGNSDYELNDYAYDTRITDQFGAEHKLDDFNAGGQKSPYFKITILPGVPVKMECQFNKVDKVTMFEYKYKDKIFRLKDIILTGGAPTAPAEAISQPQAAPAPPTVQAVAGPAPMLVGDVVLACFGKDDFYRKRYLPAKVQTIASTATKGETQLIVINDETPDNTWTTDILTKWHNATAAELRDGTVVIYTDDDTPDVKSVYFPGIVVMTDELYKGTVSVKGRWGDISKIEVKCIAIVDYPGIKAP